MMFTQFRKASDRIATLTGHAKEEAVRDLLLSFDFPEDRVMAAMMLAGRLAHIDEPYTTGIKETFIANDLAIEDLSSHEAMHDTVIQRAKGGGRHDIESVWHTLRAYLESTDRSKARKADIISGCLQRMPGVPEDAPFLLRLLTGKMGNGVDDKTILHALFGPDHDRKALVEAYAFNPNLATWVWAHHQPDELQHLYAGRATPGVPLEPQLCARVKHIAEVLTAHGGETIVQPKLDGMRINVHLTRVRNGTGSPIRQIQLFTREQKDVTQDYGELFDDFKPFTFNKYAILDGELVALASDGSIAPFSHLQKRLGRKTGRGAYRVGIVLYDILRLDEVDVQRMPYKDRLRVLADARFGSRVQVVQSTSVLETTTLHEMLREAHDAGEEGLVCKNPHSRPKPGMRHVDWVKLKADYLESTEFGDSYDLCVVGYNRGRGRRYGTIGALWLATSTEDPEGSTLVCKVGTGFTDEDLAWFKENLEPAPVLFNDSGIEVPVMSGCVVEVKAAQVSQDESGAYSLRFPRFIRVRTDKEPRSATTLREIVEAKR